MYSDMSTRIRALSSPNSASDSALDSSVLPTPRCKAETEEELLSNRKMIVHILLADSMKKLDESWSRYEKILTYHQQMREALEDELEIWLDEVLAVEPRHMQSMRTPSYTPPIRYKVLFCACSFLLILSGLSLECPFQW